MPPKTEKSKFQYRPGDFQYMSTQDAEPGYKVRHDAHFDEKTGQVDYSDWYREPAKKKSYGGPPVASNT